MPAPSASTMPAALPLFADDSSRTQDQIDRLFTAVAVRAGRVLVHEGSVGREFFVIAAGTAVVRRGHEIIGELDEGDFFGEMALLGEERRTASVVALTDMEVLVANPREFRALLQVSPRFAESMEHAYESRLLALAS
ncbi:MAG: cyclic nucleotide-binding domain-containing protein [Acidimicrobiales bacterium]